MLWYKWMIILQHITDIELIFGSFISPSLILSSLNQNFSSCDQSTCFCSSKKFTFPNRISPTEILSSLVTAQCKMDENKTLRDICQNLPPEIENVSFNSNNLTNLIDLCGLQNLKILDVSQNSIVDSLTYYQFENLIFLNLSLNVLKFIRKEEFVSFPNIEILDLSNNDIYYIDQEAFKLVNLKCLFLNGNKISYINERIFRFLINLEFLDLNSNRLSIITSGNFFYLHNLRRINLSYNKLRNIDRGTFDNLEKIELVDLSFNNFTKTPILSLNLKYFIFDGNPIKILRQYSFENSKFLRKISMRNSSFLTFIAEHALNNLTNLYEVSFDNCPGLNYVSKNFAHNSPNLKILSLENCSFRVVPEIFIRDSTLLLKMKGNPLDCRCLFSRKHFFVENDTECSGENSQKLIDIPKPSQKCPWTLSPSKNSTMKVILGSTVSLYCAIAAGPIGFQKKLLWTKNGRKLRMIEGKISTSDEKLTFSYTEMNDTGFYGCRLDDSKLNLSRYVFLQVKDPNVGLFVEDHSPFWIYLRWNKSAQEMPTGEYFLEYYPASSKNITDRSKAPKHYRRSFLPTIATFYRIINLKPNTNYSFCLLYSKVGKILYKSCVDGSTAELVVGFGTTANYTLLFLFLFCTCSTLAVCLIKCLYRYFHIWQESKHKGRMQETLSTQSFLSNGSSRRCSSVRGEVITFENMATTIENGAREKMQETDVDEGENFQENGSRSTAGQKHVDERRISATSFLQMTMDHKNV